MAATQAVLFMQEGQNIVTIITDYSFIIRFKIQ